MRVAVGSDMAGELPASIEEWLRARSHTVVRFGALADPTDRSWPAVGLAVAREVSNGQADFGIVCCWTGTGVSIAANKVRGIRAALCTDAVTAAGAREWNDANVLCLSLRLTSQPLAEEILTAWFATVPTSHAEYLGMIEQVTAR